MLGNEVLGVLGSEVLGVFESELLGVLPARKVNVSTECQYCHRTCVLFRKTFWARCRVAVDDT